jgi:N-methylhydantoinase A
MTSTQAFDFERVNAALDEIAGEGDSFLAGIEGAPRTARELFCEARYRNQLWEIDLPLGDLRRFDGEAEVARLQEQFDALHEAVFEVRQPGEPVEVLAWRGDVRVHRPRPALPIRPRRAGGQGDAISRPVYFGRTAVDARVWRVAELSLGDAIDGPAIIEEPTTTIVIPPGARAMVRPSHYLIDVGGSA